MAYINQDGKKRIEPKVKEILKRYGVKGTLSIRDFSTLTLKVKSGKVDFDGDVNGPASGNPKFLRRMEPKIKKAARRHSKKTKDQRIKSRRELNLLVYIRKYQINAKTSSTRLLTR